MLDEIKEIIDQFNIAGELINIKCNSNGNINKMPYINSFILETYKENKQKVKKIGE